MAFYGRIRKRIRKIDRIRIRPLLGPHPDPQQCFHPNLLCLGTVLWSRSILSRLQLQLYLYIPQFFAEGIYCPHVLQGLIDTVWCEKVGKQMRSNCANMLYRCQGIMLCLL